MILLMLQKGVKSLAGRLAEFFTQGADGAAAPVTASAWTQGRAKLRPTAFIELNEAAVLATFYAPEHAAGVRRWCGHRLCALDGSLLHLPHQAALGDHFGWVATANAKGPCAARHVMARASVCYDVLNRLVLDARLEPAKGAEREVGALHLAAVGPGDVVVTDRGYNGREWFERVRQAGADFVGRVPRRWHGAADALFRADAAGVSVTAELARPGAAALQVRLVTVRLVTGELEVLATSLLDEGAYPTAAFGALYAERWGVETFYGLLKGRLELENFSGHSVEAVQQDFFSSVLLGNLESVLSAPAQAALSAGDAQRQQSARVNRARSFQALKGRALALFDREAPAEVILAELTCLMQAAPVAQRRQRPPPPRRPTAAGRSLHHQRYQKKHVF